jgi:transcriptional regulator with XRE-family HTH domain
MQPVPTWPAVENALRRALALNVRRVREASGLSLHQAAERAELHWRHWQKVEAGEANVTITTVAKIAVALDIDPLDLLTMPRRAPVA